MGFFNWLKSLFAPANQKTTLAGIATLAGVAATCTGMATGAVPITPGSIGMGLTGLASGVGLLAARDGVANVDVAKVTDAVSAAGQTAMQIDPLMAPLHAAIDAAGKQADTAARVVAIANAVQALTTQAEPPKI
jgi:hypothetical protein